MSPSRRPLYRETVDRDDEVVHDQTAPNPSDVAVGPLREQWDAAFTQAMAALHEQTEDSLSELQARIRRSRFRLVLNPSDQPSR